MKIVGSVAHIPGPPIIPFFGNALMSLGKNASDIPAMSKELSEKYGSTYRVLLGHLVYVITVNPLDIQAILKTDLEKSGEYEMLKEIIGDGLGTKSGSKWASRRKLLNPAFHLKKLETFAATFDTNAEILVQSLRESEHVDIYDKLRLYALDNICGKDSWNENFFLFLIFLHMLEALMDAKTNAQSNPVSEYLQTVDK